MSDKKAQTRERILAAARAALLQRVRLSLVWRS